MRCSGDVEGGGLESWGMAAEQAEHSTLSESARTPCISDSLRTAQTPDFHQPQLTASEMIPIKGKLEDMDELEATWAKRGYRRKVAGEHAPQH